MILCVIFIITSWKITLCRQTPSQTRKEMKEEENTSMSERKRKLWKGGQIPNLHGIRGLNFRDTQINTKEEQNIKASAPLSQVLSGVAANSLRNLAFSLGTSSIWCSSYRAVLSEGSIQKKILPTLHVAWSAAVTLHHQREVQRKKIFPCFMCHEGNPDIC